MIRTDAPAQDTRIALLLLREDMTHILNPLTWVTLLFGRSTWKDPDPAPHPPHLKDAFAVPIRSCHTVMYGICLSLGLLLLRVMNGCCAWYGIVYFPPSTVKYE